MGLAVPTSIMVGTGKGAQLGILFRTSQALQSSQEVDTIALDKTGTITEGKPRLIEWIPIGDLERNQLLAKLARVQEKSEHPLAKAIVEAAKQLGTKSLAFVTEFVAIPGLGVHAKLSDRSIVDIGSIQYMSKIGVDVQPESAKWEHYSLLGNSVFFAAIDGALVAVLVVADAIKDSSTKAINELRGMNKKILIITGDSERTALAIAEKLGVPPGDVHVEKTPREKADLIAGLQLQGSKVAFVGDGINDAPALSIANVGVAIGTGTDLAIETADVILMSGDLQTLPKAISLSRSVMTNIKQNLVWAFGYNILLIPMAAGAFQPWTTWGLSPVLAALAMSLSSFFVVANALRLRQWTTR
jgi:Cu+-exporting ATPase